MDELGELIEQFRADADYPIDGRPERETERAELAEALTAETLADPDVRLLRPLAGPAYGSAGPQPWFYRLQTEDDLARVTETLRYLLYGPVRQPHFVTFAAFPLVKVVYLLKS